METSIDCATACVNGCVLGDRCPHRAYAAQAKQFVQATPLDQMHEIAEAARLKKLVEPPKWIIPDEI
ncbi:MAG: hypothetical protein HC910_10265 [Spirulinaceae cyanobacterium SM2_1_0]|nr:hypothetical protein [Spirulinaceae cyanobacterium SM2_1_0]